MLVCVSRANDGQNSIIKPSIQYLSANGSVRQHRWAENSLTQQKEVSMSTCKRFGKARLHLALTSIVCVLALAGTAQAQTEFHCQFPPFDTTVTLCEPGQVMLPVISDGTCQMLFGVGQLIDGYWVYYVDHTIRACVAIRCTDAAGNVCADTFCVTVRVGEPPVCNVPPDTTIEQCDPTEVRLPVSATNSTGCTIASGPGALVGGYWVYTPTGSGTVSVVINCGSACGAVCVDSFHVTFNVNQPPVCHVPPDTAFTIESVPFQICLPVYGTDPDNDPVTCEQINGAGTLSQGQWCFTWNTPKDTSVLVNIRCMDKCDTCTGSFRVTILYKEKVPCLPLVCNVPNDTIIQQCVAQEVRLPVSANNAAICSILSGPGLLSNGFWAYTPTGSGKVCVAVLCADTCNAVCEDSFCVTFDLNVPPVSSCPPAGSASVCRRDTVICFGPFTCSDPDGNGATSSISYGILSGNTVCFTPDTAGLYTFKFTCTDACGATGDCTTTYRVTRDEPPKIQCLPDTIQVSIGDGSPDGCYCGICHRHHHEGDGHQCFDHSGDHRDDSCSHDDTYHHDCDSSFAGCDTVRVSYVIIDLDGPVLHVSIASVTLDGTPAVPASAPAITDQGSFIWPTNCQPGLWCFLIVASDGCSADTCRLYVRVTSTPPKQERCTFTQGFYGNCNGKFGGRTSLEIMDALITASNPLVIGGPGRSVKFANGSEACIVSRLPAGGTAAALPSGLGNATIGSTTCQTSPVALPLKNDRFKNVLLGQTITLALNVRFDGDLGSLGLCPIMVTERKTDTIPSSVLSALTSLGLGKTVDGLLTLANRGLGGQSTGGASLTNINCAVDAINTGFDECALLISCDEFESSSLSKIVFSDPVPSDFRLNQNYPNPFNAGTVISFNLKGASDWNLAIYNILGQEVRGFDGRGSSGSVTVTWEGTDQSGNALGSGIYFYRLRTGSFMATKKMLLLR
jgi:hypothetical protein